MSRVAELLRSRRVPQVAVLALMSVGFAGCSADMQTRFSELVLQSLCLAARSDRFGAHARRRTPRAAAICPAADVRAAIPVPGLAAARRRCAASLSGQLRRGVGRRARDFVLCAAVPFADRDHRHGSAALGRRRAPGCAERHHDHRRHQRHARQSGEALQRFLRRDPAGQWLQGPARAVARPATDHSAADRGGCAPHRRSRRRPASRLPLRRRRRASISSIAAIR